MGIQYCDKLCYIFLMGDKRTYKSHKEHGEDMTYESEVKHRMDDRGNLDLTKQIDVLKAEKVALYESVKNLKKIKILKTINTLLNYQKKIMRQED